jgi:hypothetical protein
MRFGTERNQSPWSYLIVMPKRFEDQPWYPEWKKTIDRVIAALMARDSVKPGTPQREAADLEYEAVHCRLSGAGGTAPIVFCPIWLSDCASAPQLLSSTQYSNDVLSRHLRLHPKHRANARAQAPAPHIVVPPSRALSLIDVTTLQREGQRWATKTSLPKKCGTKRRLGRDLRVLR